MSCSCSNNEPNKQSCESNTSKKDSCGCGCASGGIMKRVIIVLILVVILVTMILMDKPSEEQAPAAPANIGADALSTTPPEKP